MARIAIVGSGISGLTAARIASREHDVAVFEAGTHVGGHAWTVEVEDRDAVHPVDVGFMVYNEATYPGLTALFGDLGVATRSTEMSFSFRCHESGLEWSGTGLGGVFAWKRNVLRPGFVRMLVDVLRFNREAARDLDDGLGDETLGRYLATRGYSDDFRDRYLVPMGAAIWSSPAARMLDFPASFFVRFFRNHGLLTVDGHHPWRTVVGGSRRYVEAVARPFADRIRLRTPVYGVRRDPRGVTVETDAGAERFDHVVLACHADQALAMLRDPSREEREILGALPYQANEAVLHRDGSVLPRRPRARASWNYHRLSGGRGDVAVTYDLARLQGHVSRDPILLTLNGAALVDPALVERTFSFEHPLFTPEAERAKARHAEIDGVRGVSYCGAYWRNGFHEDGLWSAARAVRALLGGDSLRTVA